MTSKEPFSKCVCAASMRSTASGTPTNLPSCSLNWGVLALKRDQPQVAWTRLQHARELFGGKAPALWFWAATRALALQDRLEAALMLAREGVDAYPRHPVLGNDLAVLHEATGDHAAAEALLRQEQRAGECQVR